MKTPDYIPKKLPAWTDVIAKDAMLSTKDMAAIFQCAEGAIHDRCKRGWLLQPYMSRKAGFSISIAKKNYWRMADVREFIRDANRCVSAEKEAAS